MSLTAGDTLTLIVFVPVVYFVLRVIVAAWFSWSRVVTEAGGESPALRAAREEIVGGSLARFLFNSAPDPSSARYVGLFDGSFRVAFLCLFGIPAAIVVCAVFGQV